LTAGQWARRSRKTQNYAIFPIVMLTAQALLEDRVRAAAVGAKGFLAKPILPDDVVLAVRRLLPL
jgi:DNA-binding response OmpR family regulator